MEVQVIGAFALGYFVDKISVVPMLCGIIVGVYVTQNYSIPNIETCAKGLFTKYANAEKLE